VKYVEWGLKGFEEVSEFFNWPESGLRAVSFFEGVVGVLEGD